MSNLRLAALLALAVAVLSLVLLNESNDGKTTEPRKPSPSASSTQDGLTDLPSGSSWYEVVLGQKITLGLPLMGIGNETANKHIVLKSVELGKMTPGLSLLGSVVVPIEFADSGLKSHYNGFPPSEFVGHTYDINGYKLEPGKVVHILLGLGIKDRNVNRFNGITLNYTLDGAPEKKFYDFKSCFYPTGQLNVCQSTNPS